MGISGGGTSFQIQSTGKYLTHVPMIGRLREGNLRDPRRYKKKEEGGVPRGRGRKKRVNEPFHPHWKKRFDLAASLPYKDLILRGTG